MITAKEQYWTDSHPVMRYISMLGFDNASIVDKPDNNEYQNAFAIKVQINEKNNEHKEKEFLLGTLELPQNAFY